MRLNFFQKSLPFNFLCRCMYPANQSIILSHGSVARRHFRVKKSLLKLNKGVYFFKNSFLQQAPRQQFKNYHHACPLEVFF